MKRPLFAVLILLAATLWIVAPACAAPGKHAIGSTQWVGAQYFQYLGQDEAGSDLWLYPHLDGVFEVFTATADGWHGSLDSTYDPIEGRFGQRFSAVAVVNRLLAKRVPAAERKRAARLVALFSDLHAMEGGPVYVAAAKRAVRKHLKADGEAWVEASRRTYDRLLARVDSPGTRIFPEAAALRSSDDHYRSLVGDGYLDVAVVGGNSEDKETGEFHSLGMADDLLTELKSQGFKGGSSAGHTHCEKTVQLFGRSVRVRIRLTAAGHTGALARRSVATFVEGLARADVVIYFGHSNEGSGYYLSESRSTFSRFRGADLGTRSTKFYGLGKKAHQIVALNSCLSYERYCAPIRSLYDQDADATAPGFMGTNDRAPMDDFAPRVAKFLELLQKGAGPRELAKEVNAIRPTEKSPDMLFRGVLQARHSFVVPKGVTVKTIEERGAKQAFVVTGTGSDGVLYHSTGVFPQDHVGGIVQVVPQPNGVYGVSREGHLLLVSRATDGAAVDVAAPSDPSSRIIFAAWAKRQSKTRLYLLDSKGQIRYLSRKGDRLVTLRHDPFPAGVRVVAIGNTADGLFVALDAAGKAYASILRRWEPLDERVEILATPSLLGDSEICLGE